MRFMMLVKANEEFEAGAPMNANLESAITKFLDDATARGTLIAAARLLPTSAGVRVRARSKRISVIDGPFAETKELIGGYAIFEMDSKEDVIDSCRQLLQLHLDNLGPSYEGELEIRPMFDPANVEKKIDAS